MADIEFTTENGIATATFNRPQARNAMTTEMSRQLAEFAQSIEGDARVKCLVLKGAGEHFMAGGDVGSFSQTLEMSGAERQRMFERRVQDAAPIFFTLERLPQVVITAAKGAVAGAGLSFVALSDLAVSGHGSVFVLAQIKLGVSPDGSSTYFLPREVGLKRAKEIALLGDRFGSEQAEKWGLVNRVVDDAEVDAAAMKLAEQIAAGPSHALARTKALLNQSFNQTLGAQLQAEAEGFSACAGTDDFLEGVTAFMEKRAARFPG